MKGTPEERFWAKVDKTNTCWLWTAGVLKGGGGGRGYGQFWLEPHKAVMAHCFAYELLVGPIPQGLQLDHLCRVRHCVRPAHLEPVTGFVNRLRGTNEIAHNHEKTHCPQGHLYDEANTYWYQGERSCRPCRNAATYRYATRKRHQTISASPPQRRIRSRFSSNSWTPSDAASRSASNRSDRSSSMRSRSSASYTTSQ